ncbi:hypothetical protein [Leptolyngbya ohadii]|uniref:hypothetical protein n=1 Tax=Leptolyngbya ohadii TaxID=1962290 RepID=UPI000B599918|nr:hypothetical protein [Leptolyngbya ohadii]
MRTQKQWLEYKKLEQIPLTIAEHKALEGRSTPTKRLSQLLETVWQPIAKLFEASSEPHIWKTYDDNGNPIWHAYDPITGKDSEWICEEDVRVWLEQRYYQPAVQPPLTTLEQR